MGALLNRMSAAIASEVADRVAAAIVSSPYSKAQVARLAGIAATTFDRKIRGKSEFTLTEIVAIARITERPAAWFLPAVFAEVA